MPKHLNISTRMFGLPALLLKIHYEQIKAVLHDRRFIVKFNDKLVIINDNSELYDPNRGISTIKFVIFLVIALFSSNGCYQPKAIQSPSKPLIQEMKLLHLDMDITEVNAIMVNHQKKRI